MSTITVEYEVNEAELAEAVYANIYRSTSPWFYEYSWDYKNPLEPVSGRVEDDDEEGMPFTVEISRLVEALQELISKKATCWGIPVDVNFEEWDSCMSDFVLQQAVFGEVVFG